MTGGFCPTLGGFFSEVGFFSYTHTLTKKTRSAPKPSGTLREVDVKQALNCTSESRRLARVLEQYSLIPCQVVGTPIANKSASDTSGLQRRVQRRA
jgi:hypothetical protein